MIDQVAIRSRLQALVESRVQGNAWDEVKALLLEYPEAARQAGFSGPPQLAAGDSGQDPARAEGASADAHRPGQADRDRDTDQ